MGAACIVLYAAIQTAVATTQELTNFSIRRTQIRKLVHHRHPYHREISITNTTLPLKMSNDIEQIHYIQPKNKTTQISSQMSVERTVVEIPLFAIVLLIADPHPKIDMDGLLHITSDTMKESLVLNDVPIYGVDLTSWMGETKLLKRSMGSLTEVTAFFDGIAYLEPGFKLSEEGFVLALETSFRSAKTMKRYVQALHSDPSLRGVRRAYFLDDETDITREIFGELEDESDQTEKATTSRRVVDQTSVTPTLVAATSFATAVLLSIFVIALFNAGKAVVSSHKRRRRYRRARFDETTNSSEEHVQERHFALEMEEQLEMHYDEDDHDIMLLREPTYLLEDMEEGSTLQVRSKVHFHKLCGDDDLEDIDLSDDSTVATFDSSDSVGNTKSRFDGHSAHPRRPKQVQRLPSVPKNTSRFVTKEEISWVLHLSRCLRHGGCPLGGSTKL